MDKNYSPRIQGRDSVYLPVKLLICILIVSIQVVLAAESQVGSVAVGTTLPRKEAGKLIIQALGEYHNLNELIYQGAIYQPLTAIDLTEDGEMRMEMRIAIEEISARRFIRMWMDNISLNASREQRERLINEIQQFSEIYQHPFTRGDHIVFEYGAEEGITRYTHNDVLMGATHGREFFRLLLNVWLGDNPKSSDLKTALFATAANGIDTTAADKFYALSFDTTRKQAIASFIKAKQEEKLAAQHAEEALRLEQQKQEAAAALARAQALEEQRLAEEEERQRLQQLEEERLRREREEQEAIARARHAEEQLQLHNEYARSLNRWIGTYVVYPDAALRRGIAGRVEVEVVSDRNGNLVSQTIIASSGSNVLDRAAQETVENAAPMPAMPEAMEDETFTLTMPIAYILQD
jgi:protein TonB